MSESQRPLATTRKSISLSQGELVKESFLRDGVCLPLVIEPVVEGLGLVEWATSNREQIEQKLWRYGGLLFRGFQIGGVDSFEKFLTCLAGELIDYSYRSTPRTRVSGKIYTSTEYPAHTTIPQHNEMSYTNEWPMLLGFYSLKPAEVGGETPLADSRRVFERIDPSIRARFIKRKVTYVRNYDKGLDLSWQSVFQTQNPQDVEAFCRKAGIQFEWKSDDRLRTSQTCQAVAQHPHTGEMVWFNQAHLFHVSALHADIRESLLSSSSDEPPRNSYFGDGSPIDEFDLEAIRAAYDAETIVFPWKTGDIVLIDNMLVSHGRKPFRGERKVVVGMGLPHQLTSI